MSLKKSVATSHPERTAFVAEYSALLPNLGV